LPEVDEMLLAQFGCDDSVAVDLTWDAKGSGRSSVTYSTPKSGRKTHVVQTVASFCARAHDDGYVTTERSGGSLLGRKSGELLLDRRHFLVVLGFPVTRLGGSDRSRRSASCRLCFVTERRRLARRLEKSGDGRGGGRRRRRGVSSI
jgi:hypothetical protein